MSLPSLLGLIALAIGALAVHDALQRRDSILRNYPIVGRGRRLLANLGPKLRQYIVAANDEERPFTRDERSWVERAAEHSNTYFGFGTDNEIEQVSNYILFKHAAFPLDSPPAGTPGFDPLHAIPCAKVLGGPRGRRAAFRPASVVNVSAMSYGSLSGPAVTALNRGAARAGCLQNTGEGGISPYHRQGGELIYQIGTGYFGARTPDGRFSLSHFLDTVASAPVRAIEVKLSQGAKPGLGGVLPAAKVTAEIAAIRGVTPGRTVHSPAHHTAFGDVDAMLDFVELLAERTGLPVGIKSAVGQIDFWTALADHMDGGLRGVDFITVDGGEGGTGAAPLAFADHVSLPFKLGFARVFALFAERGLQHRVVWIGSGKLGFPDRALMAFALGCDMVNVAREAMLAIGCIQAQLCHTDRCPTGVATQDRWLMRGLDPALKSERCANYLVDLRRELRTIARACGVDHPAHITPEHIEISDGRFGATTLGDLFGYDAAWVRLPDELAAGLAAADHPGAAAVAGPAPGVGA